MVQRFSMYVSSQAFGRCHMDEKDNGKFVLYEDYAVLEEKLKSLAHAIVNAGFDPVGSPDFELAESIVNDN